MLLAGLLCSCGFHPVYAPSASGATAPAQAGLGSVAVALIPDRAGQLLRQALQERFEKGGAGLAQRYDLVVAFGISAEAIGIQRDSSSSRTRIVGIATWKLIARDAQRTTVLSGTSRNLDGFNVLDQEYFAADMESEMVQRRIAEAIADQITIRVAAWFNRNDAAG